MRQLIFEAAQRLFEENGFERVTVAEVARAADVSEPTVYNYFPTKEDLFFAGMEFFEERLLGAVRDRAPGESALAAFRRFVIESSGSLAAEESTRVIAEAAHQIGASRSLQRREVEVGDRYTQRLADLLSQETGAAAGDVEAYGVASALMGLHRSLVAHVRAAVAAGRTGRVLEAEFRALAERAFARLEAGLADYAVRGDGA